jgi:hypothetical protein
MPGSNGDVRAIVDDPVWQAFAPEACSATTVEGNWVCRLPVGFHASRDDEGRFDRVAGNPRDPQKGGRADATNSDRYN